MKRGLILLGLLFSSLFGAKEYNSYAVGYTLETSAIHDSRIRDSSTIYNYAYKFDALLLTQNFLTYGDISYYPQQDFAKGYQDGYRFESTLEQLDCNAHIGYKKYIIPYTYFVPTIGLRYNLYQSTLLMHYDGSKDRKYRTRFQVPLNINFGYSLSPTSDILLGYNIDEDLSDLNTFDYEEYMLKYYITFKNNITINLMYAQVSELNPRDMRQVTKQFSFTFGLRF